MRASELGENIEGLETTRPRLRRMKGSYWLSNRRWTTQRVATRGLPRPSQTEAS